MVLDPAHIESPYAFAHNLFEESEVAADNESTDNPITDAFNRSRANAYVGVSASTTEISSKRTTALLNAFFETNVLNWLLDLGGGTATFAHNLVSPLDGVGDAELDVTVAGSPVSVTADQVFTIKKGETWKFAGHFIADAARTLTLKLYDSAGGELLSEDFSLTAVASYESAEFTNETDADLFGVTLAFEITTIGTINFDNFYFNLVRQVNTFLIDSSSIKHTLRGASISVTYSDTEDFASPTTFIAAFTQTDDEQIFIRVDDPASALFWKVIITSPLKIPKFSQLWLGHAFFFKIRSRTPFAPDEQETDWKQTESEAGTITRYKNFDRARIQFRLPFILDDGTDPQYEAFVQWLEDTDGWTDPYFLLVEPFSDPRNILFVFTMDKRFRPRRRPGVRELSFSVIEQQG